MNSRNTLAQVGYRIHDHLVDRVRALASSEDEQGPFIRRIVVSDLEKGLADRHSGHLAAAKITSGVGEVHGGSRNQWGYQAIGKSWDEIRLKHERWDSAQYCSEHGRAGSVSSDADHDVGPKIRKDAARIPDGSGEIEDCFQPCLEAHPVQGTDLDQPEGKSCGGN